MTEVGRVMVGSGLVAFTLLAHVGAGDVAWGGVDTWAQTAGRRSVIEVWKGVREMELREGDLVLRRFRIVLGSHPELGKRSRGDGRTPVGHYYISEKLSRSRFRRFLGINYPNLDDAEAGYAQGVISASEWAEIFLANLRRQVPPWGTALGGRVGIHGYGGRPRLQMDWTEGCIAVSDEAIDFLWDRVSVGTPVIINE